MQMTIGDIRMLAQAIANEIDGIQADAHQIAQNEQSSEAGDDHLVSRLATVILEHFEGEKRDPAKNPFR